MEGGAEIEMQIKGSQLLPSLRRAAPRRPVQFSMAAASAADAVQCSDIRAGVTAKHGTPSRSVLTSGALHSTHR